MSPEKQTLPLKIDGWKMTFPFEMVPFQWSCVNFQGVVCHRIKQSSLTTSPKQTYQCYKFILTKELQVDESWCFTIHEIQYLAILR